MTPAESELLSQIGTIIYYGIVVLIVDCTLYGFYLLSQFIAMYLFMKHGLKQRLQKMLFLLSNITLLTATWDFVNQCALNLIQIKVSLMEPLEAGLQAQADAAHHAILPWYTMMVWPLSINVLVGNGVALWRAWAVWHDNRTVKSAIITMVVINTAFCLADAIVGSIIRSQGVNSGNSSLDTAQMFISLAINFAATGLIGQKARQNPELVQQYFEGHGLRERGERMALLLTESGAVLLLFQLLNTIFGRMNVTAAQFSPVNIAWSVIATIFNAITVLYAMAVIIMHITRRSAMNKLFGLQTIINVSTSEKNGQTTKISTLRFADREGGAGRQVTSSTGLGSDIEAQEESSGGIENAFKEKSVHAIIAQE
jgi:hypothetical protein